MYTKKQKDKKFKKILVESNNFLLWSSVMISSDETVAFNVIERWIIRFFSVQTILYFQSEFFLKFEQSLNRVCVVL